MTRFIEGVDRNQTTLFPERLDDWVGEDNAVRIIAVFVPFTPALHPEADVTDGVR
jgi:hypothetical protein